LRILADAAKHGFADLRVAFDCLRRTNFRASDELMNRLLALDATRPVRIVEASRRSGLSFYGSVGAPQGCPRSPPPRSALRGLDPRQPPPWFGSYRSVGVISALR
jgi:hypothetical protein